MVVVDHRTGRNSSRCTYGRLLAVADFEGTGYIPPEGGAADWIPEPPVKPAVGQAAVVNQRTRQPAHAWVAIAVTHATLSIGRAWLIGRLVDRAPG
jgi:hypothetical protein